MIPASCETRLFPQSMIKDILPASLDALNEVPGAIRINPETDPKSAVEQLNQVYLEGVRTYMESLGIPIDLPDERLWPDTFHAAYEWFQSVSAALTCNSPGLTFDELIRNADMHGGGFRGAAAAWVKPADFILVVADRGSGLGTSQFHMDGFGLNLIMDFATEPLQSNLDRDGHVLSLLRSLPRVALPETVDMLVGNLSGTISVICKRYRQGLHLPQYHPDSSRAYVYSKDIGPYGGLQIINRLGEIIGEKQYNAPADPWY